MPTNTNTDWRPMYVIDGWNHAVRVLARPTVGGWRAQGFPYGVFVEGETIWSEELKKDAYVEAVRRLRNLHRANYYPSRIREDGSLMNFYTDMVLEERKTE